MAPNTSHTISSLHQFETGLPERDNENETLLRAEAGSVLVGDLAHDLLPRLPPRRIPFDISTHKGSSSSPPAECEMNCSNCVGIAGRDPGSYGRLPSVEGFHPVVLPGARLLPELFLNSFVNKGRV